MYTAMRDGHPETDSSDEVVMAKDTVDDFLLRSSIARVVFTSHLSAEDGISPGALFRKKSESCRCMEAPSARSRSGGILAEGSP